MQIIKKTDRYVIYKKRSGRFGVRSMNRTWINGPEKERILSKEGLADPSEKKQETNKTKDKEGEDDKDDKVSQEAESVSS